MSAPKLRFDQASSKWNKKPIISLADYVDYRGKTPQKTEGGVFLVTAKNIKQGYIDYENSQEYIDSNDYNEVMRRGKPQIGDVLITTEAPLGNVASIDREDIALAQRVIKYRGKENILNSYFLKQLFLSPKFQTEIGSKATGGTVQGIKGSVLHQISIYVTNFDEQSKIAYFLSSVDKKITLLNKQYELLCQYKIGMMQKIFSQELRFKDENGKEFPEWKIMTLGDIAQIKRGASPRPITDSIWFDSLSNIGWVRISDVTKSSKYLLKTEQYVSGRGVKKSRLVNKEKIIMSICATIGKPICTTFDVCIHDGFVVFESLSTNTEFLYYYLSFIEDNWQRYGQPGTQVNLNVDIVSNENIKIPSLSEQIKISQFFATIDNKLSSKKVELHKLKTWKQGLLQQMFV